MKANSPQMQNLSIKHSRATIFELKITGVPISSSRENYICHAGIEYKKIVRHFISSSNNDSQLSLFDEELACV